VTVPASQTGWQPLRSSRGTGSRGTGGRGARSANDVAGQAFTRLAVTHALSTAGDAMVTVALAGSLFFSISPHAARNRVALSLLFTMLPFGVVAPFLGPAIDRSKGGKRLMLLLAAVGRVLAALLMAREVNNILLFPAALAMLILSKAHAVAKSSLVPSTVGSPEGLVRANGKLAMLAAVVGLVAATPAAAILKLTDGAWVLRVAAVVYVAAAVAATRLHPVAPAAPPAPLAPADAAILNRKVTLAATTMAVLRGVVGFLTFGVAFEFRRQGAPSWWFGLAISGSLLGGFVGSAMGSRLRQVLKEERMLGAAVWLVAAVAVLAGRLDSRAGVAILAFAVGLSAGVARLAFDAIVQRDLAEGARARSFARFEATFQMAWVVAALVPVVVPIPTAAMCFVMALATGMGGVFYVTGLRTAHR